MFYIIHPAPTYPLEPYVPYNVTRHADHCGRYTRACIQETSTNRHFRSASFRPDVRLKSSNLRRDVREWLRGTRSVHIINDHFNRARLRLASRIRSGQTDDSRRNARHSTSDDNRDPECITKLATNHTLATRIFQHLYRRSYLILGM